MLDVEFLKRIGWPDDVADAFQNLGPQPEVLTQVVTDVLKFDAEELGSTDEIDLSGTPAVGTSVLVVR